MKTTIKMTRRDAIERLGVLAGCAMSATVSGALMAGCRNNTQTTAPWVPKTLSPEQNDLVVLITEQIIPETDTPGAAAAHVNEFVDLMLSDWYPEEERDHFLAGLALLDDQAQAMFAKSYSECSGDEQNTLLSALEESESNDESSSDLPGFFRMIKELTIVGYYTSEIGATQELQYIAVPARYDGCAPLEDVGRTWA